MNADRSQQPIVHFVGSIPLANSETVFRDLCSAVGPHIIRLPDGETGIRKSWIRFLQDVLVDSPSIEVADDVPPFLFTQHDGKVVREIPRLRIIPGSEPKAEDFKTGYADMAIESWGTFQRLQDEGTIPANVKFQVSIPTPIAPTYNNMVPDDRAPLLPELTKHFVGEIEKIANTLPNDRVAIQWDVCQEVLAWEGYYDAGPADFKTETMGVLVAIGDAVPADIELGYHLCYGSPADEHMVLPKDSGLMVEMTNAIIAGVGRPVQFVHMPVIKNRTDDAYFAPMQNLKLGPETELYLGLIHSGDGDGDQARLSAARRHTRVDGIGTECGMARGDADQFPTLLGAHVKALEVG
jgi:hypothetical protein